MQSGSLQTSQSAARVQRCIEARRFGKLEHFLRHLLKKKQPKICNFNEPEPKVAEPSRDFRRYFGKRSCNRAFDATNTQTGSLESATATAIHPGPASSPSEEADE